MDFKEHFDYLRLVQFLDVEISKELEAIKKKRRFLRESVTDRDKPAGQHL